MTGPDQFAAWRLETSQGRLSDWLREVSAPAWRAAVEHPFTDALADGSLPRPAFAYYLAQDYAFVEPFTALLGHAIGHAPSMDDRIALGRFVGMLTSTENTFFERAFDAFGVDETQRRPAALAGPTKAFGKLLREVGLRGSYPEMLAVLVVAEWSYLSWAQRLTPAAGIDPHYREWIALHDNPDFEAFVGWLRRRLDEEATDVDAETFKAVVRRFQEMTRLEQAFFDACWQAG